VVQIENAKKDAEGVEKSASPMPSFYSGEDRLTALETLIPAEQALVDKYAKLLSMVPDGDIKDELEKHLGLDREHLFTQEWLLKNAQKIKGLK
jgi:hypothetical protein